MSVRPAITLEGYDNDLKAIWDSLGAGDQMIASQIQTNRWLSRIAGTPKAFSGGFVTDAQLAAAAAEINQK